MSFLFEIFGWIAKNDTLKAIGWWNLLFAALASIGSYLTGLFIAKVGPHPADAYGLISTHETLGMVTMAIIVILFLWRTTVGDIVTDKLKAVYLSITFAGLVLLFFTGYTGGQLVFSHGVGVKPYMEQLQQIEADKAAAAERVQSLIDEMNQAVNDTTPAPTETAP